MRLILRLLKGYLVPSSFTGPDPDTVSISPMGEFYAVSSQGTDDDYGIILQLNF